MVISHKHYYPWISNKEATMLWKLAAIITPTDPYASYVPLVCLVGLVPFLIVWIAG